MRVLLSHLFTKRTGGTAEAIKRLIIWLLILTTCFLFFCHKYSKKKETYTELHRRVSTIEAVCCGGKDLP